MIATLRRHAEARPWLIDAALLLWLTASAAAIRLTLLGRIPYGVHPDEAQVGTDVHRILDGDLLGVYTHAALGQPSGHAYLSTPAIWIMGDSALSLRITLALTGVLAIPLLYLLVRVTMGRLEAFLAATLLSVSYWHLLYSRVAHWSISYGTVLLAVLLCIMLGMQQRRRAWFLAGGVLLGLGVYTYNIYPIAVVAVFAFLAIMALIKLRAADDAQWWMRSSLALAGVSFVVALPFLIYISDPDAYYWKHIDNYSEVGVARSDEFDDASAGERARLIGEQAWTFAKAYTYDAPFDVVDANGIRPVFDPLTLLLMAVGVVIAIRRRREPMIIAMLCCLVIIPLPAVLQRGSIMRQPVAAAPYVALLAALPLAAVIRGAWRRPAEVRAFAIASVTACIAMISAITVRDYFWTWRNHEWVRFIYYSQFTTASLYMRDLPDNTYVYFYNERASINLETRPFLAPNGRGQDRSREFSDRGGSIEEVDRARPVAFVLMDGYLDLLPSLRERYPGGYVRRVERDGQLEFIAYELPAEGIAARTAP